VYVFGQPGSYMAIVACRPVYAVVEGLSGWSCRTVVCLVMTCIDRGRWRSCLVCHVTAKCPPGRLHHRWICSIARDVVGGGFRPWCPRYMGYPGTLWRRFCIGSFLVYHKNNFTESSRAWVVARSLCDSLSLLFISPAGTSSIAQVCGFCGTTLSKLFSQLSK